MAQSRTGLAGIFGLLLMRSGCLELPCVDPEGCEPPLYASDEPGEDAGSTWVAPDPNEPEPEWYFDPWDLPPAGACGAGI